MNERTNAELRDVFTYRQPDSIEQVEARRKVRELCAAMAVELNDTLAPGMAKCRALWAIEDACNHALAALAINGIAQDREPPRSEPR